MVTARQAGTWLEKEDCLLIDAVDVTGKHSLVTLPSLFGLNPKLDLRGQNAVAVAREAGETQAQNPRLDLSQLTDINRLQIMAQEVDLWEIKYSPEVEQHAKLSWHTSMDGSHVLLLDKESVVIFKDLLGKWAIKGSVCGHPIETEGPYDTLPEAFQMAEMNVQAYAKHLLPLLRREAQWREEPATPPQINALMKYCKMPRDRAAKLSKGQAAQILTGKVAGQRARVPASAPGHAMGC